jgi:hypothetical protein
MQVKLNITNTEKEKAMADQKTITELLKGAESRCDKFRKYHHYKTKAQRYLKQLSFVPWI